MSYHIFCEKCGTLLIIYERTIEAYDFIRNIGIHSEVLCDDCEISDLYDSE